MSSGPTGTPREQARAAKDELRATLAGAPQVSGVGLGRDDDGGYVVVVNLTTAEAVPRIPDQVRGTPVRIRISGRAQARTSNAEAPEPADTTAQAERQESTDEAGSARAGLHRDAPPQHGPDSPSSVR